MGSVSGIVLVAGLPRDNASVRLYPAASFGAPPVENTPFPATGLLQTVTSGPAHGGTGAYRFLGVTAATLRNWDRAGKLKAHRHPMNGYRLYRRDELEALKAQIKP